jgi:hypothetical protein
LPHPTDKNYHPAHPKNFKNIQHTSSKTTLTKLH